MSADPVETTPAVCIRRAGSVWTSCTCPGCVVYQRRMRKLSDAGRTVRPVSSAEGWEVLDDLLARGWSTWAIATAAGLPFKTLTDALNDDRAGHRRALHAGTVQKLLDHGDPTAGHLPSIGPTRRIRALVRVGWSVTEVADRYGVPRTSLGELAAGRKTIVAARAAVATGAAYADLAGAVGAAHLAAGRALKAGWAPPYAWAGVDIDDPGLRLLAYPQGDDPTLPRGEIERRARRVTAEMVRKRARRAAERERPPGGRGLPAPTAASVVADGH